MENWLDMVLKYVVLPIGGFVWLLHTKQQSHATQIAVMQAQIEASKEAHDREFKEMRRTIDAIFAKLDSIEAALRK
jgi:hypothetical protein